MSSQSTKQALLQQVVQQIGVEALALRPGCLPAEIENWIAGRETMPDSKLLAVIDLLDEITPPKNR